MSLGYCNGLCVLGFIEHGTLHLNIRLYSTDLFISFITSVPCSDVTCAAANLIYRVFWNVCKRRDCDVAVVLNVRLFCYAFVISALNVLDRIPMGHFGTNTYATSKWLVGKVDAFLPNRRICWTRQAVPAWGGQCAICAVNLTRHCGWSSTAIFYTKV